MKITTALTTRTVLAPKSNVVQAIYRLACDNIGIVAERFDKSFEIVLFDGSYTLLKHFCKRWEHFKGDSIKVSVRSGPPTSIRGRRITVCDVVMDWYYNLLSEGNLSKVTEFETFVLKEATNG